jgi:hypothetical protein
MRPEPRVIDDQAEGLAPDLSLSDMGVPIHVRAELGLGIVQVKGKNLLQANGGFEFSQGGVPAFGRADVVTSGQ